MSFSSHNLFPLRVRRKRRPWWPLLLSLLLHIALALFVTQNVAPLFRSAPASVPQPFEWVQLDEPRPESSVRRQVVSDSFANDLEPEKEAYLAERSSKVDRETAGPTGTPAPGPAAALNVPGSTRQPTQGPKESENDASKKPRPQTLQELLPSGTEIARLLESSRESADDRQGRGTDAENDDPTAQAGQTLDKLDPSLERSAVTLLNKKAFRYAGFLNRMGYRVFSYYERRVRSANTQLFLRETEESVAVIEAVLDRKGEQVAARLIEYHGNPAIADAARYAMEQGAWDLNPPPGAEAADGFIHFVGIFKLRSNPRRGMYYYELGAALM